MNPNVVVIVSAVVCTIAVLFVDAEVIWLLRAATTFLSERTLEIQHRREDRELREATRDDIAV